MPIHRFMQTKIILLKVGSRKVISRSYITFKTKHIFVYIVLEHVPLWEHWAQTIDKIIGTPHSPNVPLGEQQLFWFDFPACIQTKDFKRVKIFRLSFQTQLF